MTELGASSNAPDLTPLVSASQITTFDDCPRKWGFSYIAGIRSPQTPSQVLGDDVDGGQLQPYLSEGRPIDYTRPSGYIAGAALPLLPEPQAKGIVVQKHFYLPAAKARREDGSALYGFQGFIDLWCPDGAVFPHVGRPGVPLVCDFKTTSDLKWAKDEKTLTKDPQAQIYATWALWSTRAPEVDLAWVYMQTRGALKTKRVHLRLAADQVAEEFERIDARAAVIHRLRETVTDPIDLEPNPDACERFGGCPFRATCNLGPAQIIQALAAGEQKRNDTMTATSDLFATLKNKKLAMGGAAPAQSAAAKALDIPQEISALPEVPPITKAEYAASLAVMSVGELDGKPMLGVNPPEKALPPAPPVGAAAYDKAEREAIQDETLNKAEATAPKRGRPKRDVSATPAAGTFTIDVDDSQLIKVAKAARAGLDAFIAAMEAA